VINNYYYISKINHLICKENISIKKFIYKLNNSKFLFQIIVNDKNKFIGTVTDGDLRRYLIKYSIEEKTLIKLINKKSVIGLFNKHEDNISKIKSLSFKTKSNIDFLPILNKNKNVIKILIFDQSLKLNNFACFIFAGGKGKRLRQVSSQLPKPLMKIDNVPLLEMIIKNVSKTKIDNFIISVKYKKNLIIKKISSSKFKGLNVNFVKESKFLGTAGSLSLIKKTIFENILVINCDVLTKLDLNKFINYYLEFEFDALIGAAIINYDIPFGVLKDNQGRLMSIDEKPNFSFRVASGIYLFKSSLFNNLKNNTYIDMPEFIERLIIKKYNVGVFPIHEKWIDIGTPKSLFEARKIF